MYFCGRILCGNVPFTSMNGRNITFVLLRIVECTSKTKNYFTWNLLREKCPHRETPWKVVSRLLWTRPFFLGGGGGMCPLTGIRMNRKFPKECALKEGHKLFYRLRGRRVIQVYINLEKKRTAWKKNVNGTSDLSYLQLPSMTRRYVRRASHSTKVTAYIPRANATLQVFVQLVSQRIAERWLKSLQKVGESSPFLNGFSNLSHNGVALQFAREIAQCQRILLCE